jgi:hypothetical protein
MKTYYNSNLTLNTYKHYRSRSLNTAFQFAKAYIQDFKAQLLKTPQDIRVEFLEQTYTLWQIVYKQITDPDAIIFNEPWSVPKMKNLDFLFYLSYKMALIAEVSELRNHIPLEIEITKAQTLFMENDLSEFAKSLMADGKGII